MFKELKGQCDPRYLRNGKSVMNSNGSRPHITPKPRKEFRSREITLEAREGDDMDKKVSFPIALYPQRPAAQA